jgi:hypothetical protein
MVFSEASKIAPPKHKKTFGSSALLHDLAVDLLIRRAAAG